MKALYKALAAFQQDVPTIKKTASGYGYKFADLEEITKVIKPLLAKHGLGFTQPIVGTGIKTILFHVESDDVLESTADIPQGVQLKGQNEFQVMGSAITYLRRYALSSMLGLVTDEDADAAGKQLPPRAVDNDANTLKRAKATINDQLEAQGYTTAVGKKAFITRVISKSTIDSLNDANEVADALDNEIDRSTE